MGYKKKGYIDISSLHPDYIFTSTPYDIYLPEQYRSDNLKKIAKLCNVEYGAPIIKYSGIYKSFLTSNHFFHNLWTLFTSSNPDYFKKIPCSYKAIGCLKLDDYLNYQKKPNYHWLNRKSLKVVWKPRWTLNKEDSNIFKYLDKFYAFITNNKNIDFVFLYHPLLISNLKDKKYFEYFEKWIKKLNGLSNFRIENSSNFLDCVLSADVLIADHSSTIAEFATTGKPIIYTETKVSLNNLGNKIMSTAYRVNNFVEIENDLNNILNGKDSVRTKREAAKNSYFTTPPKDLTVAQFLLKTLYDDFCNLKSRKEYEIKLYFLNKEKTQKLELMNKELSQDLEKTKSSNNDLINQIELCQNQLNETKQKYSEVVNSVFWKITKLLRKFKT